VDVNSTATSLSSINVQQKHKARAET